MKNRPLVLIFFLLLTLVSASAFGAEPSGEDLYFLGKYFNYQANFAEAEKALEGALKKTTENDPLRKMVRYEQGKSLLAQEKYKEALPLLRDHFQKNTKDGTSAYNYGLALLFTGQPQAALKAFEIVLVLESSLAPRALYYSGVALLTLGKKEAAIRFFQLVVRGFPERSEALSSRLALAGMELAALRELKEQQNLYDRALMQRSRETTAAKPWSLYLSLGVEYQDNVIYLPPDAPLPRDISSKNAFGLAHNLGGSYDLWRSGNQTLSLGAGYSGIKNLDLANYNTDNLAGSLGWKCTSGPWQVRLNLQGSRSWLGGIPQNVAWGLGPGISWQPKEWTSTDFSYQFLRSEYDRQAPIAEDNLSGESHWLSLMQNFYFRGLLLKDQMTFLSIGPSLVQRNPNGRNNEGLSWIFSLNARQTFARGVDAVLAYNFQKADFTNANTYSLTGQSRSDDNQSLSLTLFKKLGDRFSLYLGAAHSRNDSNLGTYYSYRVNRVFTGVRFDL